MKKSTLIFLLVTAFTLLLGILITAVIATRKINKYPVRCRSYVKDKKTSLVTVMDNEGNMICTFYDSVGSIGHHICPDTIYVYFNK